METKKNLSTVAAEEHYFIASQWQLMWRRFKKHKLALFGSSILILFYGVALFAEFFSPYEIYQRYPDSINSPPQRIRFFDDGKFRLRPFVYGLKLSRHPETLRRIYDIDRSKRQPIYFFVRGNQYELWNLFPGNLHFFGVKQGTAFLLGTDTLGRDVFSRILFASRTSLSIGMIGVAMSFILGCILGGISGYFGGAVDTIIQRIIEFLMSVPTLPLWMALSAALPPDWPMIKVYFGITIILSIIGWTGLARVVRGKLLQLREEDFVMAAQISGAGNMSIIARHLLPSFISYLIVNLTLSIPGMILGETALSFLGLGIRPPAISWGALLQGAQNIRTVAQHPWLLTPALFVIVTVLAFNFVGDGLRDAADPYAKGA